MRILKSRGRHFQRCLIRKSPSPLAIESVTSFLVRIISGEHRGRRITAPPGKGTRPMLDRVREAVFSSLGEQVVDARVLDLFSGSGSLGLEALSRGAASARFVERGRAAQTALRENIATLRLEERVELLACDALSPRARAAPPEMEGAWADLIFLDPPYPMIEGEERAEVLAMIETLRLECLAEGGVMILHAPKRALKAEEFAAEIATAERTYGSTAIWYLS